MADQPQGASSPYLAQNPENVGAVFFDRSPDLLSVHLKNLDGIEQALTTQKAERAVANKVAAKLLEYKNPDMNGIFPKDREELQTLGNEVVEANTKLARLDRSNPDWYSAYQEAENKKQQLATFVGASKAFNKDITGIGGRVVAGDLKGKADAAHWSKKYAENIAKPMTERYGEAYENPSLWVKDLPPKLDDMLSTLMAKNYKDYQEPKESQVEIDKGTFGTVTHKTNLTDEQRDAMAKSVISGGYTNSKEAVDEAYSVVPKEVKEKYKNTLVANGVNEIVAEEEAKKEWLKDHIAANFVKEQNSYKFNGITPQERARLRITEAQGKAMANGGWLWTMTKGAIDPNSDVSTSKPYTTSNGVTIALKGNPALQAITPQIVTVPVYEQEADGTTKKDANGKPIIATDINGNPVTKNIQNHVLANGYDANGNFILVTSESKYLGDVTGDTKKELMVMNPDQAYDYVKTRVANGKYAQGADLLAATEGHRNPTTGKVTFEAAKKPVGQTFATKTIPAVKVAETKTTKPQAKTISLSDAKKANPNFKGTDAELISKYLKFGFTVK